MDLLLAVHSIHGNEPLPNLDVLKQRPGTKTSLSVEIERVLGAEHVLYDRKAANGLSVGKKNMTENFHLKLFLNKTNFSGIMTP